MLTQHFEPTSMNQLYDQVARETLEGHVIYPDRLPKIRGHRAKDLAIIFIIVITIGAAQLKMAYSEDLLQYVDAIIYTVLLGAIHLLLIGIVEIIARICLLYEEKHHIMGRYDGDWKRLLRDMFSFSSTALLGIGISFIITLIYGLHRGSLPWERNPAIHIMVLISVYLTAKFLNLERSETMDNITMERMQPLDYGSGMALNFFYGYLRLVLPTTGDREKGLKERIGDYIASQKLKDSEFPVKKLFILIPSSTFVPTNLEEVSDHWMEAAENLEEQQRDRAGVTSRSYKNSVYKIQDPVRLTDPVYVVAEGATPLKTLNEAIQYSGEKKEFFKKHQKAIILSFYERLRGILREHKDCYGLCELLYYVDEDEYGNPNVNVAKQILDRIEEIKHKEFELQRQRSDGI